ncbi:1-acyl-sn-glycerol-3-phosphate acyltransferase [Leptolyngbya sp. FACHB-261]|nr:1-acyl-sn-glycerol-3-phosphate acyltransferase [Leptolyngbya sp. FACHB-261]
MLLSTPLNTSRLLLSLLGMRVRVHHQSRLPERGPTLVVSNHRSFIDAPLLMVGLGRSIRFACHHYMSQVPVMRELVNQLGCFPLSEADHRQQSFFQQASALLRARQMVGVFPEGGEPMTQFTAPDQMSKFHRGFAHLALRAPVSDLAVVPVAIVSQEEVSPPAIPLRLLSWFDPSEPLFQREGWHPMVVYRQVEVVIGKPVWITQAQREAYRGRQAGRVAAELSRSCQNQIELLQQSRLETPVGFSPAFS